MNFPFTDGCARGIRREIAPASRSSNLERVLKRAPHNARRSGPVVRPNVDTTHVQVETQNYKRCEPNSPPAGRARQNFRIVAFSDGKPDSTPHQVRSRPFLEMRYSSKVKFAALTTPS